MNEYGFDYLNYITNVPNIPNQMYPIKNDMNPNLNKNANFPNNNQLLEPYQGFIRGNMFKNLYDPYKNYKPAELNPTTEREALLYQLLQYKFALTDLNLYLDTHPNDQEMIQLYNKYLSIEKQMCDQYENVYGPLTTDSMKLSTNNWIWKNSPWPWEGV